MSAASDARTLVFTSCFLLGFFFSASGRIFFRALVNKPVSILSQCTIAQQWLVQISPTAFSFSPASALARWLCTATGQNKYNWNFCCARSRDDGRRSHLRSHWGVGGVWGGSEGRGAA